jgi:hypothetical protein
MQEQFPFNWYGHHRFVDRSIIDDPNNGFVKNDSIIIRYQMHVVVASGGSIPEPPRVNEESIEVPKSDVPLIPERASMYCRKERKE